MRSGLYKNGRTAFATGNIKWREYGGDTIKCVLVNDSYTPQLAKDATLLDIPKSARVGFAGSDEKESFPKMSLLSPEDGICDALDTNFGNIPSGKEIKGAVIYKDTAYEKSCTLIAFIDLDFTTNGTQVVIGWDKGPSKIFKL